MHAQASPRWPAYIYVCIRCYCHCFSMKSFCGSFLLQQLTFLLLMLHVATTYTFMYMHACKLGLPCLANAQDRAAPQAGGNCCVWLCGGKLDCHYWQDNSSYLEHVCSENYCNKPQAKLPTYIPIAAHQPVLVCCCCCRAAAAPPPIASQVRITGRRATIIRYIFLHFHISLQFFSYLCQHCTVFMSILFRNSSTYNIMFALQMKCVPK